MCLMNVPHECASWMCLIWEKWMFEKGVEIVEIFNLVHFKKCQFRDGLIRSVVLCLMYDVQCDEF